MACSGGGSAGPPVAADAHHVAAYAPPGPRCDPTGAFGAPIALASLESAADDVCPRLTADELTIVFSRRNADNTYDIYQATRGKPTDPFGAPQVLGTVNSIYTDVWPTLTPDGLGIYFMSDRITTGTYHVWSATRAAIGDAFGTPTEVMALMNGDNFPYVTATGTGLYFASSDRPDTSGMSDMYRAPLDGSGTLGTPAILVGAVNTTANELVPVVTSDELTLYFCRDNATDCDIWTATRASATAPWGTASPLAGESTVGIDEVPSWVSPDGCDLYFYDNGSGGSGGEDMYELARPAPTSG